MSSSSSGRRLPSETVGVIQWKESSVKAEAFLGVGGTGLWEGNCCCIGGRNVRRRVNGVDGMEEDRQRARDARAKL